MRKVVLLEHMSLDGFVAGPNGEIEWVRVDDQIWDFVEPASDAADTAIYGRVTYGIMESYWPTAADRPGASEHDVKHGRWANAALKLVVSRTLETVTWQNSRIVRDPAAAIEEMKRQPGKNLLLLGSISVAQALMRHNLIDEYRLTVNPVVLGDGRALFAGLDKILNLKLIESRRFDSGVMGLVYEPDRSAA